MRAPLRRREQGLRFNITPLIDIVFLLVIFFLVATHFVSNEAREPVSLPLASLTSEEPPALRRLVITVQADGTLLSGGRALPAAGVAELIAADAALGTTDYEVHIRADRTADFTQVEPILRACAQSGVTQIKVSKLDR
ncbi:MAG: biopolymer transporter ExbD [Planctomycetaceae bacterium]